MNQPASRQSAQMLSWPMLLGCLGVLFAGLKGAPLLRDADTLWHIQTGRWILLHQSIPNTDPFSHTFLGQPWTSHEWLSSLLLAMAYEAWSWAGVITLPVLAFGLTIGLMSRDVLKRLDPIRALFVMTLVLASLATHLLARPHVLAMPLLAIWVIQCVSAVEQNRVPAWWLVPLMILWANLHGSFIVGILLIGVFAVEALSLSDRHARPKVLRQWAAFLVLVLAAALATPHHIHGLYFPFQLMGMTFATSMINEWRSPNFQNFELQELWILLFLFLGWSLRIKAPWPRLVLLAYVLHASLMHTRHLTLVAIIAPIILAGPLQQSLAKIDANDRSHLDRLFNRLNGKAHPLAVLASAVAIIWLTLALALSSVKPPLSSLPENALKFLQTNPQQGKVLNAYGYGGALIFSSIPVAIDGRADLYGDAFLRQHVEAIKGMPGKLPAVLDQYDITWTFLETSSAAVQLLDLMPGWARIYADDQVVMHRRQPAR